MTEFSFDKEYMEFIFKKEKLINNNELNSVICFFESIDGKTTHRWGFFPDFIEAENFAEALDEYYKKLDIPHMIYVNGLLY